MEKHTPNCSIHTHCAVYHADGICNHETCGKCDCGMEKETPENNKSEGTRQGFKVADEAEDAFHALGDEIALHELTPTPKDWRKEWDMRFIDPRSTSGEILKENKTASQHKDFITQLLAREREEMVKVVQGMHDEWSVDLSLSGQFTTEIIAKVLAKIKSISKSV